MQITQSKQNIVEKILRDREGKLVRARFYVYERNGRIKAQLLDFVYVAEQVLLNSAIFALQGIKEVRRNLSDFSKKIVSNSLNFKKEVLNFTGSKPRAPTI